MPVPLVTLAVALAGAFALDRANVPAGALIGAMLGVGAVKLLVGSATELPEPAKFVAYATIGWLVGQSIDRSVVHGLARIAVPLLTVVVVLLAVAGVTAFVLARAGVVDSTTAFLATAPGGLSHMAVLSSDVGANVPVVVGVHLVRVVAVLLLTPFVVRFLPPG